MEALTAAAVAALTIYDMCKSADRSMVIGELALWEKTGGRSGIWRRPAGSLDEPLVNTPPALLTGDGLEGAAGLPPSAIEARIDGLLHEVSADADDLT